MKKLYVVTEGEYSDYHIEGIFSSKDKAELFAEPFSERRVEVFELDPKLPSYLERGYKFYLVNMFQDGSLPKGKFDFSVYQNPTDDFMGNLDKPLFQKYKYPNFHTGDDYPNDPNIAHTGEMVMTVNIKAKNEKHAIKIANEKRTQLLALEKWGKEI